MGKATGDVYVFCGPGQGVPGLPHRVTKAEASARGAGQILEAAIANGNYRLEGAATPAAFEPREFTAGEVNLADGVSSDEAALAGKTLAQRKKEKKS